MRCQAAVTVISYAAFCGQAMEQPAKVQGLMMTASHTRVDMNDVARIMEIALAAGDLVMRMQRDGYGAVKEKSNAFDIVTEADLASETLIRTALERDYPGVPFWGEESNTPPDADEYWIVDPIDGTVNYANGVPSYAVNIALNRRAGAELAVTLELPARRIYWARRGHGAFRRDTDGSETRLHVNTVDELRRAILSTGFPYTRAETADNNTAEFVYFLPRCHGIRRIGSCAVDMALVAAGAFAAHWENDLNPWDIAPGALLIHEAGGLVTDYDGNPWTPARRDFIAGNGQPALHQALLDGIKMARADL